MPSPNSNRFLVNPANDTDLPRFGGDGTSGGMSDDWKKSVEDRLGQLHTDAREIRNDLTTLKVDIATIKENMRHLPTQTWLFKAMAGMVATMGVIVAVIVRFLPAAQ